jgi:hypothetical protein
MLVTKAQCLYQKKITAVNSLTALDQGVLKQIPYTNLI